MGRTTSLPVLLPEIDEQRFDCHACTRCCRELVVQLTSLDRKRLDAQNWAKKLGVAPHVRLGRQHVLNHKGGACVFLQADDKCRLHAESGPTAKPLACRLYPFTLERESAGLRAGLRFDCPTVAASEGSPIARHHAELAELGSALQKEMPREFGRPPAALEIVPGSPLSDAGSDEYTGMIGDWLGNTELTIHHRLLGLHEETSAIGTARRLTRSTRFDEARFLEFTKMLISDMPTFLKEVDAMPDGPPTARQMKLLHQAVFAHCEHVPFEQAHLPLFKSLALRWDQIKRARSLGSGAGSVPPLGSLPGLDRAGPINEVVAARDLPEDQCAGLMTRYLQARVNGRSAFGAGYYGWDILSGLRSLLLAAAVVGGLTRHIARVDGRTRYSSGDVLRAVGMVDRTAGRAPELGATSARLRVAYLGRDVGLRRLLKMFPVPGS